jgi:hypothetical protein
MAEETMMTETTSAVDISLSNLSELPKGSEVELTEIPIIVWVPKNLASLQIISRIPTEEKLIKIAKEMTALDVFEAHQEYERLGEEGFTYSLTDKWLERLNPLSQGKEDQT